MTVSMHAIADVADADFRRYQKLMLQEAGIHMGDTKRALLVGRLSRRLRELGIESYGTYCDLVHTDRMERARMLDLLLTNETGFFREPAHFDFLRTDLIPRWKTDAEAQKRERRVRIWSAGCATGEEPYSLAMLLHDALDGWTIQILATDLSTAALQQAREGVWPIARAGTIPEALLRRYMLRGVGPRAGLMSVVPELRSLLDFQCVNLNEPAQFPRTPFDLVFCRNVLIYFAADTRRRAIERLIASCDRGGWLFVGHAETLQGYEGIRVARPTIWRRV
jgi:chemotaxis protein methyltransferase CheR